MKKLIVIQTIAFITLVSYSQNESMLVGIWKGTSICLIKSSSCNNEIAVYHFSKTEDKNIYKANMNKVVDGKEVQMGTLNFTYDSSHNALNCIDDAHNTRWDFKINGSAMEGTLFYKSHLYRIIKVNKEN